MSTINDSEKIRRTERQERLIHTVQSSNTQRLKQGSKQISQPRKRNYRATVQSASAFRYTMKRLLFKKQYVKSVSDREDTWDFA